MKAQKNVKEGNKENTLNIINNIINSKYFYICALTAIGIIFFILKLAFLNHYPMWDESVYLGMGKYIYSNGASGLWEMIRPLGLPSITGLWWSLGLDQMVASRVFSILISIGCIITTFLIAKELFGKKHALLSAVLLAFTPIFFFYSDYVMTDHISTLLLILSILFLMKNKFVLGGIFAGLAFWFKFTHILFIGAIVIYCVYKYLSARYTQNKSKMRWKPENFDPYLKKYMMCIAIIILFAAAYFGTNYILYKEHFDPLNAMLRPYLDASGYSNNPYQNTYFTDVQSFLYYIFYYLYNIIFSTAYGLLAYVFFIIYFFNYKKFIRNDKENDKHALFGTIFVVYLVYFSAIPYKNERFWIFFLPFMAIYASYGIMKIFKYLDLKKAALHNAIKILLIIIILIFFALSAYKISQFYNWLNADERPNYEIERYYDIHSSYAVDGPILTSDPRFTTYSDKRYIGAYDILNRNGLYVNDWDANANFSAVIYNDKSIPCLEDDARCIKNREELVRMIEQSFTRTDSYTYHGANITFYTRK